MEQNTAPNMNWQTGAPAVSPLVPRDRLRIDLEALARLHATLGSKAAGSLLSIARDEMAHHLGTVASAHTDCAFDLLAQAARRIRRIATEIGLPEIRRAADHVLDTLAQEDPTALAATVARLCRIGGKALEQVALIRLPSG